jgi:hypothetical protein
MSEPPLQHHPQKEMSFPEEKWLFVGGKKVRRNMMEKKPKGVAHGQPPPPVVRSRDEK